MFEPIVNVDELAEGKGMVVDVGEKTILIFNAEGEFHALDNYCAHRGKSLVQGALVDDQLFCPWHGNAFDLRTGTCTASPEESVRTYPVQVREGRIWVQIQE